MPPSIDDKSAPTCCKFSPIDATWSLSMMNGAVFPIWPVVTPLALVQVRPPSCETE